MNYSDFLQTKRIVAPSVGIPITPDELPDSLFPFQKALTSWALRKGRAALFPDTGTGKTRMGLVWNHHAAKATNGRSLTLAPLAVADQWVKEGEKIGIPIAYCRHQKDVQDGLTITNYEMMDHFNIDDFGAVCLEESSILKAFSGITKKALIDKCRRIPMRLCLTATPAPNDVVELTNHADFLSVMSPADMLSTFFISKGQDQKASRFRLKNHARKAFFRFFASWAMAMKKPSDLGFSDEGYDLPPLNIHPVRIHADYTPPDRLFLDRLKGVTDRANVRRSTIDERVQAVVDLIANEPDEQWLIWCGLNQESDAVHRSLGERGLPSLVVQGSDSIDHKTSALLSFASGLDKRLITKLTIAGHGLNLQRCARMAFVGIGDSYEQYYQGLRRCWRYGQARPVEAYVVYTDAEEDIYANVLRKEQEAQELSAELIANAREFEQEELQAVPKFADAYIPQEEARIPSWLTTAA